ncbi:MAG TPA: hypothetical protein VMZ04_04820 [Anaerolineae bacterium]|nr:hypothetical protein [Anaerolineae bacterium]
MFAEQYIDTVVKKLSTLLDQFDSINKAAELIVRTVLGGNRVFVVDKYGIIDNELVERASGLALFNSLKSSRLKLAEDDVLIISAYHPEDEHDQKYLNDAHSLGAMVIVISPQGTLAQSADIALLNNDDGKNGVITASGIDRPFCPVSGIMNATLAWSLAAESAAKIMANGKIPTVFWGNYLSGGTEKLSEARKRYATLGY